MPRSNRDAKPQVVGWDTVDCVWGEPGRVAPVRVRDGLAGRWKRLYATNGRGFTLRGGRLILFGGTRRGPRRLNGNPDRIGTGRIAGRGLVCGGEPG